MLSAKQAKLDAIVHFQIPDELLVKRITGRRIHKASGRSYHTEFHPPKVEGVDDITGEPLMQRKDDNAETLGSRLGTYHAQTVPVLEYYSKSGLVKTIDASQSQSTVYSAISDALGL